MRPGAPMENEPLDPPERGIGEFLLGTLTASALLPFLQALINKAGEDVYTKIGELLSRRFRSRASAELEESGSVTLVDPERRVVLRLPARLSPEQALTISNVMVPPGTGWYLVSWDDEVRTWHVAALPERPSYGLDVTDDTP